MLKKILSTTQRGIWEYISIEEAKKVDSANKLGPFRCDKEANIGRSFECNNYNSCLTHAALNQWGTFTCRGCGKVDKMVLED